MIDHIYHAGCTCPKCLPMVCGTAGEVRPRGSEAYHDILRQMGEMHAKKQADYGTPEDPYANYRSSEDIGIPAWKNSFLRTTEKVNRVKSFIRNGRLENEGIEDAFMDIAVTAIISLVTWREDQAKEANDKS